MRVFKVVVTFQDRNNRAITRVLCTINCLLTDSSPVLNAVMVVLAEPICTKVGVTDLVVNAKVDERLHPYQCWQWLEDSVHVLISGSKIEQLRCDPLCHTDNRHILSWPAK